ncbi:MAG: 2-oxo acid dehydrogenase subunit E2 [Anaerolineae bacterium]|nr:2-oxo acid dehydrogenase subunit E2 [Anaerolineae bacterium]
MPTEIIMPAMEMAQDTGRLVRWLKPEGAFVRKGEPLMEIETDKVTVEIESPAHGILSAVTAHEGDEVPVGQVIGLLLGEHERVAVASPTHNTVSPAQKVEVSPYRQPSPAAPAINRRQAVLASPKARRLAVERNLDLAAVHGSGPDGAIVAADIEAVPTTRVETLPARVIPIKGVRKIIADRLQASYQTAPHIALTLSINMTEVLRVLDREKDAIQAETGHGLTLTALLVRLVAAALLKHPRLNAHLVDDEIHEYDTVHLGIAVALDDGLIVPVIRHVERKGLATIQAELHDLTERARTGKLKPEEVKGSTFTLSNLGMFGIEQFTAILNPPEVGILTVGAVQETPVGINGQLVLQPMMCVTLCADHRAVDGAMAAAFLKTVKQTTEHASHQSQA